MAVISFFVVVVVVVVESMEQKMKFDVAVVC